jgi:hypothetical protein
MIFAIIKIGDLSNLFEGISAAFFHLYQLIQADKHVISFYAKKNFFI